MTPSPMPTVSSRAINYGLAGIGVALTFVILIPFSPSFPLSGLDGSWQYAMNVAVAEHLRFGKDVIFTVGPLASVYTHVYSPDTDKMMIAASIVVTLAFVAGLILTATTTALPWLLLLPFIAGQVFARDSLYIILPFLLLCACEAFPNHSRLGLAVIFLLAIASGLLPLIKGNALFSALVCTSLSVAALWQYSRGSAISVAAVALSAMILTWIASGQSLSDLPDYFFSQQQIVAGYTDAMSWPGTATNGNLIHLVVYLILACLLIWFAWRWTKAWRLTAGLTLTLFMCWKSAFVRHDAHALIAATGLFLSGYVIFLRTGPRLGIAALALGLGGWFAIGWSYIQLSPSEVFSRTANAISTSATGAVQRLIDPQHLKQQFSEAVAKIAQAHPLPAYSGTADVYPADLSILLASGTKWVPRPVIQSYSAYTPALLNLNKLHLTTAAPSRIYFKVQAIDNRYPSLEDGASWPTLLSHFTITGFADDYAILQRRELAAA
jgi:MFS family permease